MAKGSADDPVKGAGPPKAYSKARAGEGGLPHAGTSSEWKARSEKKLIGPEGGFNARNLWDESKPTREQK